MFDVLIVGAGPAGAVAATVLARAGVRVRLLDRATFPRDKLCGDTVNPGTLALLRRLKMAEAIEARGVPVDGMVVTGGSGVVVKGRYPRGLQGRAVTRAVLDWALVQQAIQAGATFEPGVHVRSAVVSDAHGAACVTACVGGVMVGAGERLTALPAPVTIAADGRRSTLAFGLDLARHPPRPRRWAIGAYFEQVAPSETRPASQADLVFGEMHIRRGRYIGVAPVAGGSTNVCLVKPSGAGDAEFADPATMLMQELEGDPLLADRFGRARMLRPPVVLGPLAVETSDGSIDGLLLAGDASGFVDPMTGDGLRFAVRGGELAALAALDALEHGWSGVHQRLRRARRQEFGAKWRFNRGLRALVGAPLAIRSATAAARLTPGLVRTIVARAGDCDLAG